MMEYEEGGLSDQGGSVDPVSGNKVPPGALQEEVRDDIDAKLSEGEFVFPADVVRYIGLEKLMMMRQQAKQGLAMMEKMGQMSNADEAVMEDTAPAEVFDIPDDMDLPAVVVAELEMAEGGDVQQVINNNFAGGQDAGGEKRYKSFRELMGTEGDTAEIVTYVNEAGRKIIIMHLNGAPVSQVPEGFYPEGSDPPEDDGTEDDAGEAPPEPPAPPPVKVEESGNDPDVKSGGVIVTGGYIDSKAGRVVGGDQWNLSYDFDGSVTLENTEHGKVTLSKEEAANIGIGGGGFGLGSVFAALSPSGVEKSRERQANLSSGSFDDPAAGNEIHKALVEKATLQKMGEQFVKNNSEKVGLGASIASAFGLGGGKPNEIEERVANILGKSSNQFTDADYQIIGEALAGTPNQYKLPGSTQTDATKVQQIAAEIAEIQSGQFSDMSMPKPKPTRNDRGLGGLDMPDITMGKIGDSDDDPPGPGSILSPPSGISGDDPFFDDDGSDAPGSSVPDGTGPQDPPPPDDSSYFGDITPSTDDGDDNNYSGNSYDFSSGGFESTYGSTPSGGDSFTGAGPGGFFGLNKGALVKKKRRGLASRS